MERAGFQIKEPAQVDSQKCTQLINSQLSHMYII